MIEIQSWSTGQPRSWQFTSRKEAFSALRNFKSSYFCQVFYIRTGNRKSHVYTLPAECSFEYFNENIMEYVKVTRILP